MVCFPDARAVFSCSRTANACFTQMAGPFSGKTRALERQVKRGDLAVPWGDSLAGERRLGAWDAGSLRSFLLGVPAWGSQPRRRFLLYSEGLLGDTKT